MAMKLGEILVELGVISESQLRRALQVQQACKKSICHFAEWLNSVSDKSQNEAKKKWLVEVKKEWLVENTIGAILMAQGFASMKEVAVALELQKEQRRAEGDPRYTTRVFIPIPKPSSPTKQEKKASEVEILGKELVELGIITQDQLYWADAGPSTHTICQDLLKLVLLNERRRAEAATDAKIAAPATVAPRKKLGELLVEAGVITQEILDNTLIFQQALRESPDPTPNDKIGECLVRTGFISRLHIIDALIIQHPEKNPEEIRLDVWSYHDKEWPKQPTIHQEEPPVKGQKRPF